MLRKPSIPCESGAPRCEAEQALTRRATQSPEIVDALNHPPGEVTYFGCAPLSRMEMIQELIGIGLRADRSSTSGASA